MKIIVQDLQYIDEAIRLHDVIFDAHEQSKFNNKEFWTEKINTGGLFVVACGDEGKVIGFTVCDKEDADFKVWICGVHSSARGKGVWQEMWNAVKLFAKEKGYTYILLNTFPERYPAMYSFLQKENAEIYKKEETDKGEKYFAKLYI